MVGSEVDSWQITVLPKILNLASGQLSVLSEICAQCWHFKVFNSGFISVILAKYYKGLI